MPPLLHQVFRPVPFCTYYRMAEIADTRLARLQPRAGFKLAAVWTYLGVLPFFIFIIAFLIFPATNLFAGAFQDAKGNFTLVNIQGLFSPYILKAYRTSLEVSLITSLSGGVLGFFVAYAITMGAAPRWVRSMLLTFSGLAANFGGVPLAFAFIATMGRTGFVTAILKSICYSAADASKVCPLDPYEAGFSLYSTVGLAVTYTYFQFPLMVLVITPAIEGLKREWREAAENLGASAWQYWWHIGFPVLLPSILGATLLLFGSAFGAYATAQALTGGSILLVTIVIGQQIRGDVLGDTNLGYALAFGMVVVMAVCIALYTVLDRRTSRWLRR